MTCLRSFVDEHIEPRRPSQPAAAEGGQTERVTLFPDAEILVRAAGAANGAKFCDLWQGRWQTHYPSQSEADFALIDLLAFYSGSSEQVARLFRQSALGLRDKASRNDYLDPMLSKAIGGRVRPMDFTGLTCNGRPFPIGVVAQHDTVWISAANLRLKHFDPSEWIIPGIVPQGAIILGGRPKLGKSWAALDWAIAVAEGLITFGKQCEAGDVLYAALEDTLRRLKKRMWKLKGDAAWSARLSFLCELKRSDEGGVELVREWLLQADRPRLVIVDTLAKVRSGKGREEGNYDADYRAVTCWKDLADEFNVAILLVHHVRKLVAEDPLEMISGTNGLTGAADAILILNRTSQGCSLGGRGRDLEEFELAVRFDPQACRWSVLGNAADVQRSSERNAILGVLQRNAEPLAPKLIATMLGTNDDATRQLLLRMTEAGEIIKVGRGLYSTPNHDGHIEPPL